MRRFTFVAVALVVIVILLSAPAAQAQYLPQEWGYVHANLASTRYNLARIWEDGNRESDRIWANSRYRESVNNARTFGSYYGSPYYGYTSYYGSPYSYDAFYGYPFGAYSGYGADYGRPGHRGRGGARYGYRHGATQDNVNAWGAINLGAQVVGSVISEVRADKRHREEMAAIRESERNIADAKEERRDQVEPGSASVMHATVYNGTGECLQVNGVVLDKGGRLTIQNPQTMQVATETGSSCKVYAEGIGDGILLTCRK